MNVSSAPAPRPRGWRRRTGSGRWCSGDESRQLRRRPPGAAGGRGNTEQGTSWRRGACRIRTQHAPSTASLGSTAARERRGRVGALPPGDRGRGSRRRHPREQAPPAASTATQKPPGRHETPVSDARVGRRCAPAGGGRRGIVACEAVPAPSSATHRPEEAHEIAVSEPLAIAVELHVGASAPGSALASASPLPSTATQVPEGAHEIAVSGGVGSIARVCHCSWPVRCSQAPHLPDRPPHTATQTHRKPPRVRLRHGPVRPARAGRMRAREHVPPFVDRHAQRRARAGNAGEAPAFVHVDRVRPARAGRVGAREHVAFAIDGHAQRG